MSDIQRLTIDGKGYVLLREEDYEDLIDGREADAVMARIRAGEETWPAELVRDLMQTDSRIRTFRKYRGLAMTELARDAGISQPYLSDIENGKKTGSVDVLKRIAVSLAVDLDDLVV
ncbi:DNA-binding XRE family transcriptional regulator [Hoeflea marina]|uniref:DNA-binding XRE family transcriptional regulator n=1 Tax=Hoeflea marina TaxID=274592 RepID=A0A317PNI7_9HYPH|nr:helix-turn-helix transcriptional regulator [Hoeflea marina]PWW02123.1 DNA-binding XRE family transcriptional regulator [Hoeflea marina]